MTADELARQLINDLQTLDERFADEEFCNELYRALTRNDWRKDGEEGHLSMSFAVAEGAIDELRERLGHAPLALESSGGEGEVSDLVSGELGRLGWSATPMRTDRHDPEHLGRFQESPPRAEREPPEWERRAHEEADESLRQRHRR